MGMWSYLSGAIEVEKTSYEIIIADDGSTDNSYDIIQSFTKQFPYIHYYKKKLERPKLKNMVIVGIQILNRLLRQYKQSIIVNVVLTLQ